MKFWLKKMLGKNEFNDGKTTAAGNRETVPRPDNGTSAENRKDYDGNPMVFAILAGVLGTVVTLGVIYYIHTAAGGNWITEYIYSLVYQRGALQFVTLFFFWLTVGLLLGKYLNIEKQNGCFEDSAIQEFSRRVSEKVNVGQQTIIGLLESFESECRLFRTLPILYNRILQGLKQARISENQADVANVLVNVEDTDYMKMESSYNMIKFMIWIIPILGFIGTLVGMSGSISSFQGVFDALKSADATQTMEEAIGGKLTNVTSGLALAFDTTLLALILSACLNFFMTTLVRKEEALLVRVHHFVLENIINRFSSVKNQMPNAESYNPEARQNESRHRELIVALDSLKEVLGNKIDALEGCFDDLQAQQRVSGQEGMQQMARLVEQLGEIARSLSAAPAPQASGMPVHGLPVGGKEDNDSQALKEALEKLTEKLADLPAAAAAPAPDFSPLAGPLEDLNRHMAHNAEAVGKLGDFREHLANNTEKLEGITQAINQLIDVNRKLGKVMATIIEKTF